MALQPMYLGMVNSPQTELASAIDATQTSIPLLDASVLPDPPNLATIGTGENAETILYTGKSGNVLTGVTRGFQGTAQAWVMGTKVARLFTAYDYNALINNLKELMDNIYQEILTTNSSEYAFGNQVVSGIEGGCNEYARPCNPLNYVLKQLVSQLG